MKTNNSKVAAKAAKTNKVANANVVSKSTTAKVSAKADKAPLTEEEIAAKAAKKLDASIRRIADESTLLAKHSLANLPAWCRELKVQVAKVDSEFAKQIDDKANWAHLQMEMKLRLNHVVVLSERENKETGEKETIRRIVPVMWVAKTDKISLPDYFLKEKIESYRYNDTKGNGDEVAIEDSKELAITRSVKVPVMEVVTNSEGVAYTTQKQELNSEGVMKKVFEDKDKIFVPLNQIDFDFKEIKNAWKGALLATFGSKAAVVTK